MSRYVPKTWKNRTSQYPTRRRLSIIQESPAEMVADVSREEGSVTQIGDMFSASTMNDLETRIDTAFGSVDSEMSDIVNVYGAKNLIPYPYNQTTRTVNGITFTDNGDGTVTVNGTATADAYFALSLRNTDNGLNLKTGKYLLTGCPSGGGSTIYQLYIINSDNTETFARDTGNGFSLTLTSDESNCGLLIRISNGVTVSNLVFKPMLRLASIQDDTWVPYVPTNKELMSCKLNGYVGAKNLLAYPYKQTTKSENGVTFTDNGDGTITVNTPTSASAETTFYLSQSIQSILDTGMYILSGCPSGGNRTSSYFMEFAELATSSSNWKMFGTDTGEGAIAHIDSTHYAIHAYIRIRSGATVSNLTFKPMIRRVEDTDPTWQPYAMTNRELTEDVNSINKDVNSINKNGVDITGIDVPTTTPKEIISQNGIYLIICSSIHTDTQGGIYIATVHSQTASLSSITPIKEPTDGTFTFNTSTAGKVTLLASLANIRVRVMSIVRDANY